MEELKKASEDLFEAAPREGTQSGSALQESSAAAAVPDPGEIIAAAKPSPRRPRGEYHKDPGESLGAFLARVRQSSGISLDELFASTRINKEHLTALENDDYDHLPALVYVMGYVRKLGGIYGLPDAEIGAITAALRDNLEYELPDDLSKSVISHEGSEENDRKLKLLMLCFGAFGVFVVAALLLAVLLVSVNVHSEELAVKPFDETLLLRLQPPLDNSFVELKTP